MNILYDERLDGVLAPTDKPSVLARLQQALPDMTLLHREEDLRPFECDGLSAYRVLPMLVAMPHTLEQVETLMRSCFELGVPVVTRGAGTGLSGGALPL
ncbi:MAG TPA: FAD-binding oxidoreductase, partial [Modicisalibacter sp.]|nr:FAD-binding oxidoreductase [Modicisalibacter sp.]